MRLNLGSGDLPAPAPWVNVDANAGVGADVVADARRLPFADASASAVYCGHLLEHLPLIDGVPAALAEIRRVMREGASVCFVGPDLDRAIAGGDAVLVDLIRTGGNRWEGDAHLWESTAATALSAIRDEFPNATEVSITDVDAYWPVASRVEWQFAIMVGQ